MFCWICKKLHRCEICIKKKPLVVKHIWSDYSKTSTPPCSCLRLQALGRTIRLSSFLLFIVFSPFKLMTAPYQWKLVQSDLTAVGNPLNVVNDAKVRFPLERKPPKWKAPRCLGRRRTGIPTWCVKRSAQKRWLGEPSTGEGFFILHVQRRLSFVFPWFAVVERQLPWETGWTSKELLYKIGSKFNYSWV